MDAAFRLVDLDLSDDEHMDTESLLEGNEGYDYLIELNSQFRNTEGFKQTYEEADDITKAQYYNNLVAWYVKDVAWAKRNLDFTLTSISETYEKHLGLSKKKFFKEPSIFKLKFTKNTCVVLYVGFLVSFLFALAFFILTVNIHS